MQKSKIYKELLSEYDRKRVTARLELNMRKEDLYKRLPRIREIDEEIAKLGLKASLMALSMPDDADELADSFRNGCERLINERNDVLFQNKIPKKYLDLYYECDICKDTGFIDEKECKCFSLKRIEKCYNMYALKDKLKYENFDYFDFRYYSTDKYKNYEVPPRANIEKIYNYCVKYVSKFNTKYENLIFFGNPGLGKTFLCNCISKDLMDKGYIVVYLTAFQLFRLLDDIQFRKIDDGQSVMDDLLTCDLLIVDDIGTEFSTALTSAGLFNIINSRANAKKPIIISTNLYPDEIRDSYTERIYSRLNAGFTSFEMYGQNVGTLIKYNKFLS